MKDLIIAIRIFVVLTILTGVLYPLAVTAIAQTAFKSQANGSLIVSGGKVVGSRLIGQPFDEPKYLWGRPSATSPTPYNAAASSGSNLGPTNPALKDRLTASVKTYRDADPSNTALVPTELVTSSASGLDPHISVEAALYQVHRIAKARGLPDATVKRLVRDHTIAPTLGLLGEPVVNVLEFNLALDDLKSGS
ncbi:MAG: potassium-transporting ATPase subunit KdpC [Armatimonadetes bacterium]|nr:potassium-transporting ATPase subunit KdpC [Armatimonadota bacterium]